MKQVKIKCAFCKKIFSRSKDQFKEAKKFNWKQFCSWQCLSRSKLKGSILNCANLKCKKRFWRKPSDTKRVKRSFCSQTCFAKINNQERKLSKPVNLKNCACISCDKLVMGKNKYCSRMHSNALRKFSKEQWRTRIIGRIKSFYKLYGRIPVKREMAGIYVDARKIFGSWNKAIKAAGFKPNPVLFSDRQTAKDGHICDSVAEMIIDDWLQDNKIVHDRNVHYPGSPYTADFMVNGKFIEFFGLVGEIPAYDKIIANKRKLAKKHNISLIEIYPKDLYARGKIDLILKKCADSPLNNLKYS